MNEMKRKRRRSKCKGVTTLWTKLDFRFCYDAGAEFRSFAEKNEIIHIGRKRFREKEIEKRNKRIYVQFTQDKFSKGRYIYVRFFSLRLVLHFYQ